jgi:pimeloyl-ACP methyl ester carboxylesterase
MRTTINNADVFVSTGGRDFDAELPTLVFIHGSGQSHLSFMLQARFLANRGFSVLNPDMPAHGLSGGAPLTDIAAMADWYAELMDQSGVKHATIIGHSQGALIGLELARRHPRKVEKFAVIASAAAIPVNDMLLGLAKDKEPAAIDAMIDWGHGETGHMHDHTMPGQTHLNFGRAMMANNETGALYADLKACADYDQGMIAAATVSVPCLCILATADKMTPLKFGKKLAAALPDCDTVIIDRAGHMLPTEKPFEVITALRAFIS